MSLKVNHLTKVYGQQYAVNDISLEVEQGEIVAFLGPNGAGKSTTMKIATGYIPPTAGNVIIEGHDVTVSPLKVRKITGYLPEHNPLYLDLYVNEYLQFIGKLYGLSGASLRRRVAEMVELCGLTGEQNKRVEALSKGYRQRVGLAQALIHDPKVLILDEPTTGLDPNQILEIRKLIKNISLQKTVILSTHIMQEVQALCDRVIVINRGIIVADDTIEGLMNRRPYDSSVIVEFEGDISADDLRRVNGVREVVPMEGRKFRVVPDNAVDIRPEIFRFAADRNLSLVGLKLEENSLEDIFRVLTSSSKEL